MTTFSFEYLETVHSTNAYLLEKQEKDRTGVVVYARTQTAGKGMAANVWESEPGMNLTFSMGVDMSFMKAADQFLLSQAVPLGMVDGLDGFWDPSQGSSPIESLMLKWPNDLVVGKRKLAGILINSTIHGMDMGVSVIGIGLNVNQMQFKDWPTHPVSLKMVLGGEVALEPLLHRLVEAVDARIALLRSPEGIEKTKKDYLDRLYRYHTWADYEVDGARVRRYVTGIDAFGRLETMDESGAEYVYDIKEIKWV